MAYQIFEGPTGVLNIVPGGPGQQVIINGSLTAMGGVTQQGHIVTGNIGGVTTTATNGIAASNATVSPALIGNDSAGYIVIGDSGNPVAGAEVFVQFGSPFANRPYVDLTPANPSTAGSNIYAVASTNSFTVFTGISPAASGTLAFSYSVNG